ncbi:MULTISPECIES: hypothetical protein [Halolamina]|uniref:Uncharacterized protein n=2 Tax=Halolamina TaxID=1075397 RepID=A0A1I5WCL7_9EURY|nr:MULTISPECIES: hypothetical protein [Halolamina]NHX37989.1 hypothetical protein [Halolamina sp. R1-12]SFQ17418.1 hypothetical protein SAMN05216277_1279 [Halolamina pelagica]
MDRTSIPLGTATRDALKEYKEEHDLENYNAAVQDLLPDEKGLGGSTIK